MVKSVKHINDIKQDTATHGNALDSFLTFIKITCKNYHYNMRPHS